MNRWGDRNYRHHKALQEPIRPIEKHMPFVTTMKSCIECVETRTPTERRADFNVIMPGNFKSLQWPACRAVIGRPLIAQKQNRSGPQLPTQPYVQPLTFGALTPDEASAMATALQMAAEWITKELNTSNGTNIPAAK